MPTSPWYDGETCVKCGRDLSDLDHPRDSQYVADMGNTESMYRSYVEEMTGHLCVGCRQQWSSHASTAALVDERGKYVKVEYGEGIIRDESLFPESDCIAPSEAEYGQALMTAVTGTEGFSVDGWRGGKSTPTLDEFEKVKSGWHSTVEHSSAFEALREVASGHGHRIGEIDGPVIVVESTTSNVMSRGLDLYVLPDDVESVREAFEGTSSGLKGSL